MLVGICCSPVERLVALAFPDVVADSCQNIGIAQPYLEGNHSQRFQSWQKYLATNLSGEMAWHQNELDINAFSIAEAVHPWGRMLAF